MRALVMNLKMTLKMSFLATSLLLAACARQEVAEDIDNSVAVNQQAKSVLDWEESNLHPMYLVTKWKDKRIDSKDICDALLDRTGSDLTLFEEQIKDPEFAAKISMCSRNVQEKIDDYWVQARIETGSGPQGKFPDQVVYRDFSNGYYTVTADLAPKQVLLTFDDGPHGIYTDSILKSLREVNAKALFFAMGESVRANPAALRRVGADGHAVGSHSNTHACLPMRNICKGSNRGRMLSFSQAVAEIVAGHTAVFEALGWVDPFFRFPYGESSAELKTYLREHEMGEFYWTVDSNDWRAKTPEKLIEDTMSDLKRHGRGVLLFHDIQKRTALAMPRLLQRLNAEGYKPVLLRAKDPNARIASKVTNPTRLATKL